MSKSGALGGIMGGRLGDRLLIIMRRFGAETQPHRHRYSPMHDKPNPHLVKGLINQYPLIYLQSREEQRLERQLTALSRAHYGDDRPIMLWSTALGLQGDAACPSRWR